MTDTSVMLGSGHASLGLPLPDHNKEQDRFSRYVQAG